MQITIQLPDDLRQHLVNQSAQLNISLETLILRSLRQSQSSPNNVASQWSEVVLDYTGSQTFQPSSLTGLTFYHLAAILMRYLLDTCVISDFIKGELGTQARIKQTPPTNIAISAITVMELRYGLQLNPQRAQKIEPVIASFLSSVAILPFDILESEQAAQIRAVLKMQGQPIGAYDVLIAATALRYSFPMVTANQREFDRVPGLQIENWRQP